MTDVSKEVFEPIAEAEDLRPVTEECLNLFERYPDSFIDTISPRDHMYDTDPGAYEMLGKAGLRAIRTAMLCAGKHTVERFLDMGSGHGRVLRFLKAEYPHARLAACDIDHEAVDFCATAFGATPVYGHPDPEDVALEETFDVIWSGSLLTHLDEPLWHRYFEFFESALEVGGVLVVTTQGRAVVPRLRDPQKGDFYIQEERRQTILQAYERNGFGYEDYDFPQEFRTSLSLPENFGISLADPSFTCSVIERYPRLKLVTYEESGWGEQDVVGCIRLE
jgi:SAM-dependent methyltransferase